MLDAIGKGKNNMENILYHYCSVESFFNILKSKTIWLSDVSKSNDFQECILCRDRINDSIEKNLSENDDDLNAWRGGLEFGLELNRQIYTYCACFSESCDQLSQWRGYADNGAGISIGFNKKLLLELGKSDEHRIAFSPIIYDLKKQNAYVEKIVKLNFKTLERKGIGHVATELNTNYRLKFPFLKHPSFWEEKEWRMAVSSRPGTYSIKASEIYDFSEVKYRVTNGKLISYIEMNFSKIKQELIKEIWIVPKSCVGINDVIGVLDTYGYYEGVGYNSDEPVLIRKSKSTYR